MPRRLTMSDLRTRSLRRFDLENHKAIVGNAGEANSLLSEQYGDLYSVVAGAGLRYFEYSLDTTMAGGVGYISEPADHLSTVDTIERVIDSNGRLHRLRQLMPQERWLWSGKTGHARRWELVDDRINLYPTPPAGDVYRLRYIPQPPDLTNYGDNDVVDVVTPDGEAFIIWGFGVKALSKLRSDVTLAMQERETARARLSQWASLRAFNDPPRVLAYEDDDDWPYRDGEWYYDR